MEREVWMKATLWWSHRELPGKKKKEERNVSSKQAILVNNKSLKKYIFACLSLYFFLIINHHYKINHMTSMFHIMGWIAKMLRPLLFGAIPLLSQRRNYFTSTMCILFFFSRFQQSFKTDFSFSILKKWELDKFMEIRSVTNYYSGWMDAVHRFRGRMPFAGENTGKLVYLSLLLIGYPEAYWLVTMWFMKLG